MSKISYQQRLETLKIWMETLKKGTPKTKKKTTTSPASSSYKNKSKKRRKGIHSKTKTSKSKNSTNYIKRSVGQGS